MHSVKLLRRALSGVLIAVLLIGLSLAVPDISVKVQPLGLGACQVKSPVTWATITLYWSKSGGIIQTWTLTGASVVFSNDVSGPVNFTAKIEILGYRSFGDTYPTLDVVRATFSTNSEVSAGIVYPLTISSHPQYVVLPSFYPQPEILNVTSIILGGLASCSGKIGVTIVEVGTGSGSYSPPPLNVSEIRIIVNNTKNPELRDYVINFTVSTSCVPDLSKVYVTDSSGKQLYFWAFNDSANNKIWFWVNYTVPANSVREIIIHLNGTGTSQYFDPNRVFWNFVRGPIELIGSIFNPGIYRVPYNVSNILAFGYEGYVIDAYASLGHAGLGMPFLGPYWVALTNGNYYGLGIADSGNVYTVSGPTYSDVNIGGNPVGEIPSWGPGFYSITLIKNGRKIVTKMSYEGKPFADYTFRGALRLRFADYFTIGQDGMLGLSNQSIYYWIGIRPVMDNSPKVFVPTICSAPSSGAYTFTLYFRP